MEILLFGLNHRSAPVEIRERLAFAPDLLESALPRIQGLPGIQEGMVLSTCNRTEVLAVANGRAEGFSSLRRFLETEKGFLEEEMRRYCYEYSGEDAVRHLFRVSSSLDSMILGETQILGQVKQAYGEAREVGATGPVLDQLLRRAFSVAKKVRTSTGISRNPVSISSSAAQLARQIFGDLDQRSIMVVGSGKMSELAARHLIGNGVKMVLVANRTYHRAMDVAKRHSGTAIRFDQLLEHLLQVDVVLTSTAAPHPILKRDDIQRLMRRRRNRPIFFIDIAVPRDVDPSVNEIDNVYLYDIDDLQAVVDVNRESRQQEAIHAEQIIEKEVGSFFRWLLSRDLSPTIVAFRMKLHSIRTAELRKYRKKLGPLSRLQEEVIGEMTAAIVNKILHHPIHWLRRSSGGTDALDHASVFKNLFDLPDTPEPDRSEKETES